MCVRACAKKRLDDGTGVCVVLQRWLKAQSHLTSLLLCTSQLILRGITKQKLGADLTAASNY